MLRELSSGTGFTATVCYDEIQARACPGPVLMVQEGPTLVGLSWPRQPVGVICRQAGPTSHLAIAARNRGIFCAVALDGSFDADVLHVGGRALRHGSTVSLTPAGLDVDGHVVEIARESAAAVSADDCAAFRLTLMCNADSATDAALGFDRGAVGVGSVRTEHLILGSAVQADLASAIVARIVDQRSDTAALARVQEHVSHRLTALFALCRERGAAVSVRLLDLDPAEWLGADDLDQIKTVAPTFLEARGIQLAEWLPELCAEALPTAVCRAAVLSGIEVDLLTVVVPYVSDPSDVDRAARILARSSQAACLPAAPRIGVMIETLDAVRNVGVLAGRVAGFTLGTNDLAAQVSGYERDKPPLSGPSALALTPDLLDVLRGVVRRGRAENPALLVGVCGEAAQHPPNLPLWADLNLDFVSPGARRIAPSADVPSGGEPCV